MAASKVDGGFWRGDEGREDVDSGLLVLDESLYFTHKISGQSQDLLHVVAFSHFWKGT